MRFTENGPSIPDALLNARDEGRVVFFCGAGVSRAKAGLPDFFGLAESVLKDLGVTQDSDARKVLDMAREVGQKLSITGLISTDRVFGLLERDFTVNDIRGAVARSLRTTSEADLSAHKTLLRLARTPDSITQLVTTNFDRLFEDCDPQLSTHQPPRLPNPTRFDDLDGIVYLHGCVNRDYSGPDQSEFILSSADFGHAYLSEGWAAEFFRDVVRNYVVVFIGYSADDPPIQYLLEGLHRGQKSIPEIYAFQSGDSEEVVARWRHKGVDPVPYSTVDGHSPLWETLELWADRADNPIEWRKSVIEAAKAGPRSLRPFQRGQIAHIVSSDDGALAFAESRAPAEWLCVFDPCCRYARHHSAWPNIDRPIPIPFDVYGLDSDQFPDRGEHTEHSVTTKFPEKAWSAFDLNKRDHDGCGSNEFTTFRGPNASEVPNLPKRLRYLAWWIAEVADQPASVWWAVRQEALHPSIGQWIARRLSQSADHFNPIMHSAWRGFLESTEELQTESRREWYDLQSHIKREGWNRATLRKFSAFSLPLLKATPGLLSDVVAPSYDSECRLSELVRLEVEYSFPPSDIVIPDEYLERVVRGFRTNLEIASQLHAEFDEMRFHRICPLIPDPSPDISDYERTHGLSGYVVWFASLFERLLEIDLPNAKREFAAWRNDDDPVFCTLRIWACGKPALITPHGLSKIFKSLSDKMFWDSGRQRDLLTVLATRWGQLSENVRQSIENRLLKGPPPWDGEDEKSYLEHKAWMSLQRIEWMATQGCEFTFDVAAEIESLKLSAPRWVPEYARSAADSREIRGGWIQTNTEHTILLDQPLNSVLSKAQELSGRVRDGRLEENDPFAGLCEAHPVRAYLALASAARRGEYPAWAWDKFLKDINGREKDSQKLSAVIAERLCRTPDASLHDFIYASTWWLQRVSVTLSQSYPNSFDKAISRFVELLPRLPAIERSNRDDDGRNRDWVMDAINSPSGHIAQAILEDSRLRTTIDAEVSTHKWLSHLTKLLAIDGDSRRYAIVIISHRLSWLYHVVPAWTEEHLLVLLDAESGEDQAAIWAGFSRHPKIYGKALYSRLKPSLLALAKTGGRSRRGHIQSLASVILRGWTAGNQDGAARWLSNEEMRDAILHGGDEFRSQVLWQLEWGLKDKEEGNRKKWMSDSKEFFQHVWPRQKVVKGPSMSVRLCETLFANEHAFGELVDTVTPFLTTITSGHLHLDDEARAIADKHPEKVLSLLMVVLSESVSEWPYGADDFLDRIGQADTLLLSDARYRELRRRWDSR